MVGGPGRSGKGYPGCGMLGEVLGVVVGDDLGGSGRLWTTLENFWFWLFQGLGIVRIGLSSRKRGGHDPQK